jgi:hypothetical protein
VPLSSPSDWVKLNLGQHAPLRVSYPPALLSRLAEGIKDKTLPATDRCAMLSYMHHVACEAGAPAYATSLTETSVLYSSHLPLLLYSDVMMGGSAGLLLDAYNLTKTGELPATELLFLIKAYKNEDNRCHHN